MRTTLGSVSVTLLASVLSLVVAGCSSGADEPYKAAPAWSGRAPNLPTPPTLTSAPIKVGDAYTIFGAAHHLRSRMHEKEVTKASITIQGYIVQENISDAPACSVHKTGKKDADDCQTEIPSFWIADEKGAGKDKQRIRVLGWAKNFPTVFDAMQKYKNLKEAPKELHKDELFGTEVPFPLPAVGAKVKVTGKYGFSFTKASAGMVSDPMNGVMTYEKVEVVEPAPEKVSFKNHK